MHFFFVIHTLLGTSYTVLFMAYIVGSRRNERVGAHGEITRVFQDSFDQKQLSLSEDDTVLLGLHS